MRQFGYGMRVGVRLALAALFYLLAVSASRQVERAAEVMTVELTGSPLSQKAAREICENECEQENALALCFWSERDEVQFSCRETGRTLSATEVLTAGDPELAARGGTSLLWQENGCLTDAGTAEKLFGTRAARGQILWSDGRAYTVCGTFEGLEPTVILRGDAREGSTFEMLSIRTENADDAKQLLLRHGLSGNVMDFTFFRMISRNLLCIVPALLAAGLAGNAWRRRKSRERAVWFTAALLTATVCFFLIGTQFWIPGDMIPPKWSDFAFWSQWWQKQRKNLLQILAGAQGARQLGALWYFAQSLAGNAGAAVFATAALRAVRRELRGSS